MRALGTTTLLLILPLAVLAQQGTTGDLTGVVKSATSPLPGVTVTITSTSLQGSRNTTTGAQGSYHFAHLPPGDYLVSFELAGLEPSRQQTRVSVAQTARLDAVLAPATMNESLSVVSQSTDAHEVASNYRADLVEQLPAGRTLRDIALLSPSVNANGVRGRLMIAGAPFWSSVFLVDGAVVSDSVVGQPHDLFIEDAIEEMTILTGSISPEYGSFTGGVVSVRTRSGGNAFRGSARTSFTNPAWTAQAPGEGERPDDLGFVQEATLGGFVVRDRLWFFTAGRLADTSVRQATRLTNVPYSATTDEARVEAKLTAQPYRNHDIVLSYLRYSLDETNVVGSPAGVLTVDALIPARSTPATFLTAGYHGVLGPSSFVEAQFAQKTYAIQGNGGHSSDRILGTLVGGLRFGNVNAPPFCGICSDDERNNASWLLKGTHYAQNRSGTHTVVAGVENFHEERVLDAHRSSSDYFVQTAGFRTIGQNAYPIFDSTTVISFAPVHTSSSGSDFNIRSIFLNDRWDVGPRLSFSVGARYDRNDSRDADGWTVSDDDRLSPRLAVSFDLRGDGAHRFNAGYGRYVSKIPEVSGSGTAAQRAGAPHIFSWRYAGPEINVFGTQPDQFLTSTAALTQLFRWFDSVGGVDNRSHLVGLSIPGLSTSIPHSLRSPFVDEVTMGYALRVGHALHLRGDLIARDWGGFHAARLDSTTGQRVDPEGRPIDVNWIVNDDSDTSRTWRAVQLQGTWRGRALTVGGGYTWSRLRGNEDGEGELGTAEPATNRPLDLWCPELLAYDQRRPTGYLTGDQTHRARVWASYDLLFSRMSLNISALQSYDSGRAYSVAGMIDASGTVTPYEGSPRNPGYALTQLSSSGYPYYFSERGALRTDEVLSTDLALNVQLPVRGTDVFLQADVLNTFNHSAVVNPGTEVLTRVRSGRQSGLSAFNPFTTTPVEGVHFRLSPDFGKATGPSSYQLPRTYRFSAGLRF